MAYERDVVLGKFDVAADSKVQATFVIEQYTYDLTNANFCEVIFNLRVYFTGAKQHFNNSVLLDSINAVLATFGINNVVYSKENNTMLNDSLFFDVTVNDALYDVCSDAEDENVYDDGYCNYVDFT